MLAANFLLAFVSVVTCTAHNLGDHGKPSWLPVRPSFSYGWPSHTTDFPIPTPPSSPHPGRRTCTVRAGGTNATDDALSILQAFDYCGQGGNVKFLNTTYYINSIMNISNLNDCEIDLQGTLLWSTNVTYWLTHSMPVGYQNQSTAFILGGDNVRFDGHGYGTFNGNGDVWYARRLGSNYPGRPHAITFAGLTNSKITGLRFLRSQMWTMSIINSSYVNLTDIYINNLSTGGSKSSNTDGADTFFSHHISFSKFTVINGDDSISCKANSTDISITNSQFINGLGIAMGSIGQYKNTFETIERVSGSNLTFVNTTHAVYFKTWTGDQVMYPPNGGGGGLGYASNISFTSLGLSNVTSAPFSISQCTTFSGAKGTNCTNSRFQIRELSLSDVRGTLSKSTVASFQCSAVEPCTDISITDVGLTVAGNGTLAKGYLCGNVGEKEGWECTGEVCVGASSTGGC